MTVRPLTVAAVVAAAAAAASCGNAPDPKAVVHDYLVAGAQCTNEAQAREYELATSPHRAKTREEWVAWETRHACEPLPVPDLKIMSVKTEGDYAAVVVWRPPNGTDNGITARFILVREDGEWKVNTSSSPSPQDVLSS